MIDLRFVTKDDNGELLAIELTGVDDDEAAAFGEVIDRLVGIAEGAGNERPALELADAISGAGVGRRLRRPGSV